MSIGRLVVLATVATAAAFWWGCSVRPEALFPTRGGIDAASQDDILNIARRRDYDVSHGVGDFRRLMVGTCPTCTYGPHVFLSPERDAWRTDSVTLAEGRFVARLINMDADSYPKFNLGARDTVYWWVDRRGGTWRSLYVSSRRGTGPRPDSLFHDRYATHAPWGRSLARFLWQDRDEALWVACDMTGCCRSSGADIIY